MKNKNTKGKRNFISSQNLFNVHSICIIDVCFLHRCDVSLINPYNQKTQGFKFREQGEKFALTPFFQSKFELFFFLQISFSHGEYIPSFNDIQLYVCPNRVPLIITTLYMLIFHYI